jgi:hypothetical protein
MARSPGHMTTRHVQAPSEVAFRYLCDPIALGRWSLGCFDTAEEVSGLFTGRSLIDGGRVWFRIDADPSRLLIDYLVGTPDRLVRRISIRIVPGTELDLPAATCLVSLIAWRSGSASDDSWQRTQALHEAEIILIGGQIERIADAPPTSP